MKGFQLTWVWPPSSHVTRTICICPTKRTLGFHCKWVNIEVEQCKHSILSVGHGQTVQIKIRHTINYSFTEFS